MTANKTDLSILEDESATPEEKKDAIETLVDICETQECENMAEYRSNEKRLCPECMNSETDAIIEDAFGPDTIELTIFEENLTAGGLEEIQKESLTFPVKATNPDEYKFIYAQHQRFKRLHKAIRVKADELKLEEKSEYKEKTKKIDTDLDMVLKVITPIVGKLDNARKIWDAEIAAHKENVARDAAILQKAEHERREKIRLEQEATAAAEYKFSVKWDMAHAEDKLWDLQVQQKIREEQLREEKEKFDRERREFEIEKGRLTVDECWELVRIVPEFSGEDLIELGQKRIHDWSKRMGFDEAWEHWHQRTMNQMIGRGKRRLDFDEAREDWQNHLEKEKAAELEAVKIGEEYSAGTRLAVSQDELDDILNVDQALKDENHLENVNIKMLKLQENELNLKDDTALSEEIEKSSDSELFEGPAWSDKPDPVSDIDSAADEMREDKMAFPENGPLTTAQHSAELDDFQQIMTEIPEESEPMTDTDILEQIRLSGSIFRDEISRHIEEGMQSQANRTKVYNFFLTLKMFISDISTQD